MSRDVLTVCDLWSMCIILAGEVRMIFFDSSGRGFIAGSISATVFLYGIWEVVGANYGLLWRTESYFWFRRCVFVVSIHNFFSCLFRMCVERFSIRSSKIRWGAYRNPLKWTLIMWCGFYLLMANGNYAPRAVDVCVFHNSCKDRLFTWCFERSDFSAMIIQCTMS